MGIRIPLEIRRNNTIVQTSALANSGYESEEPEVHIPITLAKKLGFSLEALRSERYYAIGIEVPTYVLGYVYVRVFTSDRVSDWVRARAVTVPNEYEVIISDALIEALGIELVMPRTGLWRFRGESITRKSIEPQYWID